jgi:steroid 5-alpha reductase family enzyme
VTGEQMVIATVAIGCTLCAIMAGAWLVQQRTGNSGWVDTIWTFGLGTVGLAGALAPISAADWPTARQLVTAGLVLTWAARLGIHIAQRSAAISDDPRYAALRRQWGDAAPRQMFWLLQKQAWVTVPLALAILLAGQNDAPVLRWQDGIGIAVLTIAIVGEAVADWQLRRFRSDSRRRREVCDVGLWRWSRHPNYFFEWFGWLAYPLLAIDINDPAPWGYLALLAPLCMYWLLVHVSGIPPLEQHMLQTRGAAFRAYQVRTSAFFPLPPARQ